jgi:hypothetical protein
VLILLSFTPQLTRPSLHFTDEAAEGMSQLSLGGGATTGTQDSDDSDSDDNDDDDDAEEEEEDEEMGSQDARTASQSQGHSQGYSQGHSQVAHRLSGLKQWHKFE